MKRLLFFICLGCGAANAATMCVPDRGSCTSCTDATVIGELAWSASCCGVDVVGMAVPLPGEFLDDVCYTDKGLHDFTLYNEREIVYASWYSCGCVVAVPKFIEKFYAVEMTYDWRTGYPNRSCAERCKEDIGTIVQNLF